MKIDYYYWGKMCPIVEENLALLKEYEDVFDIHFHDIAHHHELAKKQNIFFPFLTWIAQKHRYYDPLTREFLDNLKRGIFLEAKPYRISLGKEEKNGEILPIRNDNYSLAAQCTGSVHCLGCKEKIQMYNEIAIDVIGFMNVEGDHLLGGVEYYPSLLVPYDIRKGSDIAFLTCVYGSHEQYDYKSAPLRALEAYLAQYYKEVVVISDEIGTFPNGNLTFFLQHGYLEEKVVYMDAYCKLHSLTKKL